MAEPPADAAAGGEHDQHDEHHVHLPYGEPGRPIAHTSPLRIGFTAALGVALAYALVQAVVAVRSVLVLLLVAAFLAIGLNPLVEALLRRGMSRGRAVATVLAGVVLAFAGVLAAVVPPIVEQVGQFSDALPGYVAALQDNQRLADLDERFGVLEQLETVASDPGSYAPSIFGGVLGVGKVVFGAFFSGLTVFILTLYFLSSLPAITGAAYQLVPASRRRRVQLLTDEVLVRVGGYVAGALSIAALGGVFTFVLCAVLGIPYPVALAVVVAATGLVPLIGATIGAVVVTTVAFLDSTQAGVVMLVYYLVYQQVENYVLYPRVMKRSVDVAPAATVVAVLIGASLLGVLGALLAIPLAAGLQLVLQQVVLPRQEQH